MNIPFVQRSIRSGFFLIHINFELLSLYLFMIIVRAVQGKLGKLIKVCLL